MAGVLPDARLQNPVVWLLSCALIVTFRAETKTMLGVRLSRQFDAACGADLSLFGVWAHRSIVMSRK